LSSRSIKKNAAAAKSKGERRDVSPPVGEQSVLRREGAKKRLRNEGVSDWQPTGGLTSRRSPGLNLRGET